MEAKARILIVDDNAAMVATLAEDLSEFGYETTVATNGMEALMKAKPWRPEIALVDLRMEEVDGFDVLAGLLTMDPSIQVFIMTAFGTRETKSDSLQRGAYYYLTKPFKRDEVLYHLERALADRKLRSKQ